MQKCNNCGTIANQSARFCRKCGKELEQMVEKVPTIDAPTVMVCTNCGRKATVPGARFCKKCGAALTEVQDQDSEKMKCSCGATIKSGWVFCRKCGKRINSEPSPNPYPQPAPAPELIPQPEPIPDLAPDLNPAPESGGMNQFFVPAGDL